MSSHGWRWSLSSFWWSWWEPLCHRCRLAMEMHFQDTVAFIILYGHNIYIWHLCLVCFECIHAKCVISFLGFWFHSQVASARLRGTIEGPQFIGSSIETLLFGTFLLLGHTEKESERHFYIFYIYIYLIHCMIYFFTPQFLPSRWSRICATLDPIQSLGYKGLASHSVCFESCCSDNTGMAGIQGLSEGIQSLYRGQNPSSSGKGHGAFWTHKGARWGHQKASDGHHQNRIKSWREHATIIGGRYLSGKSVAVEEALRGVRGVVRFTIESADWKKVMCEQEKLDNIGPFKEVMSRAREKLKDFPDNLTKYPILLLDIPRTTTEGLSGFFLVLFSVGGVVHFASHVFLFKCFCPFLLARNWLSLQHSEGYGDRPNRSCRSCTPAYKWYFQIVQT